MTEDVYSDSASFIGEFGNQEFKPFAYYDKHLDCIRVRIMDCSTIDERLSRIFTILRPAHSEIRGYVGFNIKGVRHLFDEVGLPHEGIVKLTDLIDRIVTLYPDTFVKRVQEEFGAIIKEKEIEVDFGVDDAAAAA